MTNPSPQGCAPSRASLKSGCAKLPGKPKDATGVVVLADGSVFWGKGMGAEGAATGELCFNTSMTGYQEIMTDPSYAGQIITFTFPHIGNTGSNSQDIEAQKVAARGVVLREPISSPSSWRAETHLEDWLERNNLIGISGVDTRTLAIRIRDLGAPNAVIAHSREGVFDIEALTAKAKAWPGLEGMDLALEVTCAKPFEWTEGSWKWFPKKNASYAKASLQSQKYHVVAIDFGAKRNILRCLVSAGCRVTVVPAQTTAEEIFALKPDGVFLSNGPGDPAATGVYAVPVIKAILDKRIPLFGICLGHQMLGLALGAKTAKLPRGHRGANHPVKDLKTGKVDITSQNHGFHVLPETLPSNVEVTHVSLFDGSNEGIRANDMPAFSVQYHPEASPGPHDSHYLFKRFVEMMEGDLGFGARRKAG